MSDPRTYRYTWVTNQTIAVTGTSAAIGTALGSQTRAVRLCSPVAAFVFSPTMGTSTAVTSTSGVYLPANTPEIISAGAGGFISAISLGTSTGTMTVTELS